MAGADLCDQLFHLRAAKWVTPTDAPATQPHKWELNVEIGTADGISHKLAIDAGATPIVAQVADLPLFTLERTVVEPLTAEFRDRTVLNLSRDDIRRVEITRDGKTIALERDGLHPGAAGVAVIVARILPQVEQLVAQVRARHPL